MKKIAIYILVSIVGIAAALFPIGREDLPLPEPPESETANEQVQTGVEAALTDGFGDITAEIDLASIIQNIKEKPSSSSEMSAPEITVTPYIPETEDITEPVSEDTESEQVNTETESENTVESDINQSEQRPAPNRNNNVSAPVKREHLAAQSEDTSYITQEALDRARNRIYTYISNTKGSSVAVSQDLQYAAIAVANGSASNGIEALAAYGGAGWRSASWHQMSVYDYVLDTAPTTMESIADTLCSYLSGYQSGSYTDMGIGIRVSSDDGCYKVSVIVLMTD